MPVVVKPVVEVESGQPDKYILLHEIVDPVKREEDDQSAAASGDYAHVFLN